MMPENEIRDRLDSLKQVFKYLTKETLTIQDPFDLAKKHHKRVVIHQQITLLELILGEEISEWTEVVL